MQAYVAYWTFAGMEKLEKLQDMLRRDEGDRKSVV